MFIESFCFCYPIDDARRQMMMIIDRVRNTEEYTNKSVNRWHTNKPDLRSYFFISKEKFVVFSQFHATALLVFFHNEAISYQIDHEYRFNQLVFVFRNADDTTVCSITTRHLRQ